MKFIEANEIHILYNNHGSIPGKGKNLFFSAQGPGRNCFHPTSCLVKTDHLAQSRVKIKTEWRYKSISPMYLCDEHTDKFNL